MGTKEELIARFGDKDTLEKVKQYIVELAKEEKQKQQDIVVKYSPRLLLSKEDQRSYNGGYLFLQKVYHELGLHKICETIVKKQHKKSKNHDIKKV